MKVKSSIPLEPLSFKLGKGGTNPCQIVQSYVGTFWMFFRFVDKMKWFVCLKNALSIPFLESILKYHKEQPQSPFTLMLIEEEVLFSVLTCLDGLFWSIKVGVDLPFMLVK